MHVCGGGFAKGRRWVRIGDVSRREKIKQKCAIKQRETKKRASQRTWHWLSTAHEGKAAIPSCFLLSPPKRIGGKEERKGKKKHTPAARFWRGIGEDATALTSSQKWKTRSTRRRSFSPNSLSALHALKNWQCSLADGRWSRVGLKRRAAVPSTQVKKRQRLLQTMKQSGGAAPENYGVLPFMAERFVVVKCWKYGRRQANGCIRVGRGLCN